MKEMGKKTKNKRNKGVTKAIVEMWEINDFVVRLS